MEVIKIRPKGIYVTFEISFEDLCRLKDFLDKAKIEFNGLVPEEVSMVDYVTNVFYPTIKKVVEDLENGS